MKFSLDERIDRLTKWYHRENDRPILIFYLDSMYPLHRYRGSSKQLKDGPFSADDIVVDDYLEDIERLYRLHEDAGGDGIWMTTAFWGVPWIESSLGCIPVANFGTGSSIAEPPPDLGDDPVIPTYSRENPWVRKMYEFIEAFQQASKGRFPVGMTLMRGITDLLAALYGNTKLVYRFIDAPEKVEEIIERLTDYWIAYVGDLLSTVDLFHGGTSTHFHNMWFPGKVAWMQDDAAALLSPKMYERYIYPANNRIINHFNGTGIHLHPTNIINTVVDCLMKTDINVIQIQRDIAGQTASELADLYRKIISEKCLLICGNLTRDDLSFVVENLPHKGLAINAAVESAQEAEEMWNIAFGN